MKKKQKGLLLFLAAGALLLAGCRAKESIPVVPGDSSLNEEDPAETSENSGMPEGEIPVYQVDLPEELSSFSAAIWGEVYTFPMAWEEFREKGWDYRGDPEQAVDSRSYLEGESFEKDGNLIHIYILNPETDILPVEDCLIAGMQVDTGLPEEERVYVNLPGDIVLGQSLESDVIEAYGDPVDRYQGENGSVLTYEYGTYRRVQLGFAAETGQLATLDLRNLEAMEETVPAEGEPSEEVLEYKEPEGPGEFLSQAVIEYGGALYRLPAPVAAFQKNGWKVNREESDLSIEGGQYGHLTLEKEKEKLYTVVRNPGEEPADIEDCAVTELAGNLDTVKVPITLAGGITLGMSQEEFLQAAGGQPYVKREEEEQDTIVYTFYRNDFTVDYTEITVDRSLKLVRGILVVCNRDRDLEQQAEG